MLAAIRCPECTAPVRELPRVDAPARCGYCGATLSIALPPLERTEPHFFVVLRVGPSNIERIVRVLGDHFGVDAAEARAKLAQPPTEFPCGPVEERAEAIAQEAREGGAQAEVVSRPVVVPLRTVTLENAGAKALAVVVALRAEIELSVVEAKRVVAETPCVIAAGVEDDYARALIAALEKAGAKASAH